MPPLDDELRAALSSRAATLPPLADPFPGVARRARTLRRRRTATAVAGSALAVLGLVGGAALALPGGTLVTQGEVATSPAPPPPSPEAAPSTPAPSAAATAPGDPAHALDLEDPWPYRSAGEPLPPAEREAYARAWAETHPEDDGTPAVLFSQLWEPSGLTEAVVLGSSSWGVVRESESGAEVVSERPLPDAPVLALVDVLAGDEVPRLLVVAAPDVEGLVHRTDPEGPSDTVLSDLAPGVATSAYEPGDPAVDAVVGFAQEREVLDVPVPDAPVPAPGAAPQAPGNVLDWPVRGAAVEPDLVQRAQELLALNRDGASAEQVESKVLFASDDDAGNRFLFGQFWLPGEQEAATIGIVDAPPAGSDALQLLRPLQADADVAVFAVSPAPGQSTSTLVVVPRPGTGQVLYAGDGATEWRPVGEAQDHLDGVVLVDRAPGADRGEDVDRIQLLDGDGVLFFEGEVPQLLCGVTSCS